ncbi:Glycerol uptake facilitator (Major Intrinsic Protein Family) [Cohaesibacter marisflavi]|uniref:Glycerol uptake facilitator (Major Intrinsic Protein Family) n=1 Tax=Cohaesibacter marisflavi TaxID=655353 RepID=A0A1I5EEY7_9HYPH|nr:MIP/aquaporin family protein [Cohaesibacter marisflavi]SFO09903.1 Glycerol uptake facilitator (Major Intrinsic Protein Family) [Cohaesibacter marisflavi]
MAYTLRAQLLAEFLGTGILLCTIIGSGIMTGSLSPDNAGVALFGNTVPPAAILFVLITIFAPISGAHFNPAVTLTFVVRREFPARKALMFVAMQLLGAVAGTMLANFMFSEPLISMATYQRFGPQQWVGELVATGGLLLTILVCMQTKPQSIPPAVTLYVTAAIWFTSSTCFANPAVSIGRAFSDTYAGLRLQDGLVFAMCQLLAVFLVLPLVKLVLEQK